MILTTENILLTGAILLFLSLFAERASHRFGVPILIIVSLLFQGASVPFVARLPGTGENVKSKI